MKDWDGVIIFIAVIVVAGVLFWGVRTAVQKSLKTAPISANTEQDQRLREQRRSMENTENRRQQMMRDNQRKLQDYRRKK